jgi:hypothetical protein
MAIYYLKSTGSDTAPYDTEEKAATSIWSIRALEGFASTDTIILCDDVEETDFVGPHSAVMCNLTAKDGLETKPELYYNRTGQPQPFYAGTDSFTISNIKLKHEANQSLCIVNDNNMDSITFNNCEINMIEGKLGVASYIESLIEIGSSQPATFSLFSPWIFALDKCTIIDHRTAVTFYTLVANDSTSMTNCIIYESSTTKDNGDNYIYIVTETADNALVNNFTNNLYYSVGDFGRNASGIVNGNNIAGEPQFAETTTYKLKTTSPAVKKRAGVVGGVNIGWDQTTDLPALRTSAQTSSNPSNTFAGTSLRDTDRGNPNGNVVDNTQAANPSRDQSKVYNVGSNVRSMAWAPHLLGIQRDNS